MKKSMKAFTGVLLSAVMAAGLCAFAACGGESHTHTAGTEWKYDESYHWNLCVADGCDTEGGAVMNRAAHSYDGGTATDGGTLYTCLVCGYSYTEAASSEGGTSSGGGSSSSTDNFSKFTIVEFTSSELTISTDEGTNHEGSLVFNLTTRIVEFSLGSDVITTGTWSYDETDGLSISLEKCDSYTGDVTDSVTVTSDENANTSTIAITYGWYYGGQECSVSCSFSGYVGDLEEKVCVWTGGVSLGGFGQMDTLLTLNTDGTFVINIINTSTGSLMSHSIGGRWYYTDDEGLTLYHVADEDGTGDETVTKIFQTSANSEFTMEVTGSLDGMSGTVTISGNTSVLSGISRPDTESTTEGSGD